MKVDWMAETVAVLMAVLKGTVMVDQMVGKRGFCLAKWTVGTMAENLVWKLDDKTAALMVELLGKLMECMKGLMLVDMKVYNLVCLTVVMSDIYLVARKGE